MQYFISFLEGIITFISPCFLPMLPVYLTYIASKDDKKNSTITNAIAFVIGFTLVFISLGAFAGTIGTFLKNYNVIINIITGLIVIIFGLNLLGIFNIKFLNAAKIQKSESKKLGFFSSILFGIVFSINWTPCVGAFLGSALMLASQQSSVVQGILLLLCFSLGLGIPFIFSAVLINQLKSTFTFIKRNYQIIHIISGVFLIIIGILMMTGLMGYFSALLTF